MVDVPTVIIHDNGVTWQSRRESLMELEGRVLNRSTVEGRKILQDRPEKNIIRSVKGAGTIRKPIF